MSSSSWRNETEGRLRKAEISLEAARALIERKPPCIDDAVNRASAAALQAARALVDARWPPHDEVVHDPTWRPGMAKPAPIGPYSKASWPVIVQQFEKASAEMALPFDAAEYLRTLVEDGHIADVGDMAAYEHEEATEAVLTADKLVRSVNQTLPLAFALGYREIEGDGDFTDDEDENATTLEVAPLTAHQAGSGAPAARPQPSAAETDPHLAPIALGDLRNEPPPSAAPAALAAEPAAAEAKSATPPAVDAPIPLPGPGLPAPTAAEAPIPLPGPAALPAAEPARPAEPAAVAAEPARPAEPAAVAAEPTKAAEPAAVAAEPPKPAESAAAAPLEPPKEGPPPAEPALAAQAPGSSPAAPPDAAPPEGKPAEPAPVAGPPPPVSPAGS